MQTDDRRGKERRAIPFLRWPGGKRWAAARVAELVRQHLHGTYYEPFLGSGAVFFRLVPNVAVLSDMNPQLVAAFRAVKLDADAVAKALSTIPVRRSTFDRLKRFRRGKASLKVRGARFIYLNRTAFSGIYRVNRLGQFNVPYGGGSRTPEFLLRRRVLQRAGLALCRARLLVSDFERILDMAGAGDVVYCDPTYTVSHANNGFLRYNERVFSWKDQQRLASAARRAQRRGATVIVTNAFHQAVLRLYPTAKRSVLRRYSCVPTNISARVEVREYMLLLPGADEKKAKGMGLPSAQLRAARR